MSDIPEYTNEQLRAGVGCLSTKYGNIPFLGAPAGLALSNNNFRKMLRQLCDAGMVEKMSKEDPDYPCDNEGNPLGGKDFYYKILSEQGGRSLVADLPVASLPSASRTVPKKGLGNSVDGLPELLASHREVISLLKKNGALESEVEKLRAQVAALTAGAISAGGAASAVGSSDDA
jgi:hypothetical protein